VDKEGRGEENMGREERESGLLVDKKE